MNLDCVYDLEPLLTQNSSGASSSPGARRRRCRKSRALTAKLDTGHSRDADADAAGPDFLQYIASLHMSDKIHACLANRTLVLALTAVPLTADPEATHYIIGEMLRIPDLVRKGRATPFVHPQLHGTTSQRHLAWVLEGVRFDSSPFSELITLDAPTVSLIELVAATQALILLLIQHAFDQKTTWPVNLGFELLARWTTILWTSAASRIPHDLDPWRSWILGESVRRAILMSYLLDGTYSAWRVGWCCHQLFVYALPFSSQGRLWLTETQQEWAALTNRGPEVSIARTLVSLKEFTGAFAEKPFEPGDDLFQRLLLVSHHGKKSVEDGLMGRSGGPTKPLMTVMSFTM
ncbi:uncharacterized protein A1O5_02939 [Cladophialophora psammophila CBS 110553]|uniref:Transcription factor domain-containing protein n=1 Tax=Cladophialophora psammophila CBS 110553 TaxID=1182543 RepID=W9XSA1_9EURO|nr:uncharacterized protein A1O5_02939 [Cladophialophora psammophila CBS 110553]EXJ73179.1 hypothetical protein A1O5_02939 [Cladophialophora psammophila CBS 110553]